MAPQQEPLAALRRRAGGVLKPPARRALDALARRVADELAPRLGHSAANGESPGHPGFFTTFHDLLHAQRSAELSLMPRGAEVLLSAGCSGSWYFDWIEKAYGPVRRHVGIERYMPRPDALPGNVEWIASSVADMPEVGDASVDLLFSGQNLEHLFGDDCTGFLLESARVLRPGGHLVMDSPNREIATLLTWSMNEHTIEFTPGEAAELVELAGFDVESLRGVWLCRDPVSGEVLPFDPFEAGIAAEEVVRRIQLAPRFPEHSFVWWLEARRATRPADADRLRARHAEIFRHAWPDRTNRLRHHVGVLRGEGAERVVSVPAGVSGYCLFGPYMPLAAADCEVTFRLRRGGGPLDPRTVVATLDVVVEGRDDPTLALQQVTAEQLPAGKWTDVTVPFHTDALYWTGQFRVHSEGVAALDCRFGVDLHDGASPVWPSALRLAHRA